MSETSSGIGLTGLLGLLFVGLRLGKVIDWSWWWVLSPFLFDAAIGLVALFVILVVALID